MGAGFILIIGILLLYLLLSGKLKTMWDTLST